MIKKILAFAVFVVFTTIVSAQSFYFTPADTVRLDSAVTNGLSEIDIVAGIYNNTSAPLTVKWRRVNYTVPHSWDQQVCDNYQCYGSTVLSATHTTQPIVSHDAGLFKIGLKNTCVSGGGVVQLRVWVPADSANTVHDITFIPNLTAAAACQNVNGIEESSLNASLSLYPNPTTGTVHIKEAEGYNNLHVAIFNVLGNKVMETEVSQARLLNLQNLSQGIYLVKLYDENKLLGVRKVHKSE